MKHLHAISRMPAPGTTTTSVGLVVTFVVAILSAISPLLVAVEPLKAQQAKYDTSDDPIPNWP